MSDNVKEVVDTTKDTAKADTENVKESKKAKVKEVKAKDLQKNKKKEKKPSKLVKSLKDTGNELKKVSWPTFKQVAKSTGIVLVVVLVFAVVLFGFDSLCEFLMKLLMK